MGILAVRKGDDPFEIARNFVRVFKLRTQLVDVIVEKIQQMIVRHYTHSASAIGTTGTFASRVSHVFCLFFRRFVDAAHARCVCVCPAR